ncbi:amiloride-sensitive sodium channel subunit beta [Callorhinchus milii]|uniref:amiloride-sensitive sodium channel subunit beta n=1 Tax=Callorhinchus milii TaxID=7868 RepID=UPI001C3F6A39|nr:amiloride-sensitive sodium channel subunit beta [Callorhinchus milii]
MLWVSARRCLSQALRRLQDGPGESYRELLVWYCETTSTHGPKRILTEGPKKRALWLLLTLLLGGVVCWQWGVLVQRYLSGETISTLRTGFKAMVFPAVTLCNVNPFRYSRSRGLLQPLDRLAELALQRIYMYNQNRTLPPPMDDLEDKWSRGGAGLGPGPLVPLVIIEQTEKGEEVLVRILGDAESDVPRDAKLGRGPRSYKVALHLCSKDGRDCLYRNFTTGLQAVNEWYSLHYMSLMANVSLEDRTAMGEHGQDFILSCNFGGHPCDLRNFTRLFHPTYGNCYIFNWGSSGSVLTVSNPGAEFGLKVVLDISQEDYNPFLSMAAGAKFMLHQQNTFPFLRDLGMYAKAGTESSITIFADEIERLGGVYSRCRLNPSATEVTTLYNTSYSMQTCLRSCHQAHMVRLCGCAYHHYPLSEGAQYCNNQDHPGWAYCYYHLKEQIESENSECLTSCIPPCNDTLYRLTISMAEWPSQASEEWIYQILSYERDSSPKVTVNRNSILKLNMYFKENNFRTISESKAQTLVWLLSNLGGQFGFWMGGSVLCIVELLEVMLDCVWIMAIRGARLYMGHRRRRSLARHPPPVPTVAQCVEEQEHRAQSERPVPSTPPPRYDSLHICSLTEPGPPEAGGKIVVEVGGEEAGEEVGEEGCRL